MSKGGDKTQTTTQNTSTTYAPWTQAAGQNGYTSAAGMTNPFLQTPAYSVAGLNPDQTKAFDLARQMAQGAFTGSATGVPTGASMTAAQVGAPGSTGASSATAAQLGGGDYQAFLNPFINGVVTQAANKARGELRQTNADIGAKYAAAGAFGGGREVLARGKAQDDFDENLQATTAQLLAQGFDTATATAMANTQMRQQTGESNAARQQQAAQADADRRQQVALTNAGYQQDASSANLGYGLQAAQVAEAMRNGQTDRQNSALQALLGTGNQQQLFAQSALDSPWTALQRLLAATPQVYNTTGTATGTQPDNSPGFLQQVLGVGGSILGAAMPGGGSLGGSLISKVLK
ncbi:hypothetical protein [Aureimonas pseudogalii]|uniref:Uncharacterized protein n=1 Tax=Aureimonas pseudogalii TaxID=1744844 RepID=A0A7W6H4K3_9HYPH|nr:hypothetical protein [Aureimonas pseudogalii]MBB3997189.1 hypothetical protein [Aureimonas pseudogalii]